VWKKKNPAVKTERNGGKKLQKTAKILYSDSEIETGWGCPFPTFASFSGFVPIVTSYGAI
jgi:hypothetical protein